MSREIKFRAWINGSGIPRMIEWDDIDAFEMCNDKLWYNTGKYTLLGNLILMQFTGLKDKNKKEIYQGDIVSFQNRIHEVCINFNGYYLQRYKLWNGKFKKAFSYSMCLITKPENGNEMIGIVDQAEVIGNIYQTPELLNN